MVLCGTYNLIQIKNQKNKKIIFGIKYKHFKYQVIFFGLANAPIIC